MNPVISRKYVEKNYVHKDKIREKIKRYKGLKEIDLRAYEEQIKPLKELLNEEVTNSGNS